MLRASMSTPQALGEHTSTILATDLTIYHNLASHHLASVAQPFLLKGGSSSLLLSLTTKIK
jgi:hypothetical protein